MGVTQGGLRSSWSILEKMFFCVKLIVAKSPISTPALWMSLLQWAPCANLLFFQCMHPYLMWGNRLKPVKIMLSAQRWLLQLSTSRGGSASRSLPNAASDAERDQTWSMLHLTASFQMVPLALQVTCSCHLSWQIALNVPWNAEQRKVQGSVVSSARSRLLEKVPLIYLWEKCLRWISSQLWKPSLLAGSDGVPSTKICLGTGWWKKSDANLFWEYTGVLAVLPSSSSYRQ